MLTATAASQSTLIGTVHGRLGETFRFYLFVNRRAPARLDGVPNFDLRRLEGGRLAKTDEPRWTPPGHRYTTAQRRERRRILDAVANTVRQRQTGGACAR